MAPPHLTSSTTGTLYFAYGSNLSPHQMYHRCLDAPEKSAVPVAIARADGWKWVICERGYANIVPPPLPPLPTKEEEVENSENHGSERSRRHSENRDSEESPSLADVVWGVLYNMTAGDEQVLDRYEGHDQGRNPNPTPVGLGVGNGDPDPRGRRLFEQGDWDYNKWYIDVTVTKWLQPPSSVLGPSSSYAAPGPRGENDDAVEEVVTVKVLTYVDELRTGEGPILRNYIGRMNRGIEESVALGLPRSWVDQVMRRWVTPGIFPERGYVGTDEGYVAPQMEEKEKEATESSTEQGVAAVAQRPLPHGHFEVPGAC